MRTSIVVPVFNGMRYLARFFDTLVAATPPDTQLVLVDDASTEPVAEAYPRSDAFRSLVQLRNPVNLGYSAAVNRGFAAAEGEVVIQLNTDLVLDENCIYALLSWLDGHPNAGVLGSKLLFPGTGRVQHIGMSFGEFSCRHIYFDMPADHPLCTRSRKTQIATGATVAMTRHVLDKIGPLDERYYNYNEDVDHCLRALERGYENYTVADSVAYHWVSQSGPARFAGMREAEALFWSTWGNRRQIDLGQYVGEALEHVLDAHPHLAGMAFKPLNLCRSVDEAILLERVDHFWPGTAARVEHRRAHNSGREAVWLGMDLPHFMALDPAPYIYLVDRTAHLAQNHMWFEARLTLVKDEIILDLTGAIFTVREFLALQGTAT